MNKILHGVIRGRTIELDADPGVEEGRQVEILVRTRAMPGPPPGTPDSRPSAAGMMAGDWTIEDDRILAELENERKRDDRPELGA